jgi:hypothetical protein
MPPEGSKRKAYCYVPQKGVIFQMITQPVKGLGFGSMVNRLQKKNCKFTPVRLYLTASSRSIVVYAVEATANIPSGSEASVPYGIGYLIGTSYTGSIDDFVNSEFSKKTLITLIQENIKVQVAKW